MTEEYKKILETCSKIVENGSTKDRASILAVCALSLLKDLENLEKQSELVKGIITFLLHQGALHFCETIAKKSLQSGTPNSIASNFTLGYIQTEQVASRQAEQFGNLCSVLDEEVRNEKARK